MKSYALGKRYAGALISIGQKDGNFEKYGTELQGAMTLLGDNKTWASFTSPLLPTEAKLKIIDEINAKTQWSVPVVNFLKVLIQNKRITALPSIVESYAILADEAAGRVHAKVESAKALTAEEKKKLNAKLVKKLGKEVVLEAATDKSLIGGVKVTVGSNVYDGTIRGQLARVKEILLKD